MGTGNRAIIIGAGVIGVTSAWALGKAGWQVQVIDTHGEPAAGTSRGNGRQLSYSHTDALAHPAILPALPALALGRHPAFRMAMPTGPAGFGWIMHFLANCTAARFRRNTLACLDLAARSQSELHDLLSHHDINFAHRRPGKLVLYRDRGALQRAKQAMTMKIGHGSEQMALPPEAAAQVEPALAGCHGLEGVIYSPADETGDCAAFTSALMALSSRQQGAVFKGNTLVTAIRRNGAGAVVECAAGEAIEADMVVMCAGHHSRNLLSAAGHHVHIQPMKGYSFTAPAGARAPEKSVTDASRRIVFTNIGERMLVAGFADLGDCGTDCGADRLEALKQAAEASLPDAALYDEASDLWCGHRPITPNSLPLTHMLEPWLAVNSGHGMLGWTLAMGSAARLAEVVGPARHGLPRAG